MVTQPHTKSTDSQNWFSVIKIRYHWSKSDITGQNQISLVRHIQWISDYRT